MCGRFTLAIEEQEMERYLSDTYGIEHRTLGGYKPRYNIAPSQEVLSVIHDGKDYRVGYLKWGFVPSFAKEESIGNRMINARSETLHEKPSFKASFKSKRCVILASGFYEWMKTEDGKVPQHILLKDRPIMPFAGLWSQLKRADGTSLFTCTIVTMEANDKLKPIHHRMPVILTQETEAIWLNPRVTDAQMLQQVFTPIPNEHMDYYPVSSDVNFVKNDRIDLINPL